MSNGSNDFGVSLPQIDFISRMLRGHPNIVEVARSLDIQFDIARKRGDSVRLVCLNEYTCGLARVLEVQEKFPGLNFIYVGGVWNSYTSDAKRYCDEACIGLFNAKEITGALYRDDFWRYVRAD